MAKKPGARAGYGASVKKAAKKKKSLTAGLNKGISKAKKSLGEKLSAKKYTTGKAVPRIAEMVIAGKKAGTATKKKQKTAAERGSRPVQERDTGPGGMTATGSKKRLGKAVGKNQKKYGTRVGTGSVSARKPSGKK